MKKVLISAFIGSENSGDEAIFRQVSRTLSQMKDVEVAAFTINKERQADRGTSVKLIQTRNPLRIFKVISSCDVLIVGGGGLIQDDTTIYNVLRHTYKALIALLLRKDYIFYAVGVNDLNVHANSLLVRFLANRACAISVRDTESQRALVRMGVTHTIVVSGDPVITAPNPNRRRTAKTKPYIAVCLRHWFDTHPFIPVSIVQALHIRSKKNQENYTRFIMQMARFLDTVLTETTINLVFIPFFGDRDAKVHRDIISHMKQSNRIHAVQKGLSVTKVDSLIGNAQFVIGMRLHSLILAAKNSVPFIALSYAPKVERFAEELHWSRYSMQVNALDSSKLHDVFTSLYAERMRERRRLIKEVNRYKVREQNNFTLLKEILTSSG